MELQKDSHAEATARDHSVKLHWIVMRDPLTPDDPAPQLRMARVDAVHPELRCKIIRRRGRVLVICSNNPRHKQRQG